MKNTTLKAILFDLDGVVADTEIIQLKAWNNALVKFDLILTEEQYLNLAGKGGAEIESEIYQLFNLNLEKGQLLQIKKAAAKNRILNDPIDLMFFAREAIEYFKSEGLKIALVTSSPQEQMMLKLDKIGLKNSFDQSVSGSEVEKHKPHPDLYLRALDKIGLESSQCLAFEDTQYGVMAAKSAGVTCFAVPNDLTLNQDFSRADKVFNNLKEVVVYLK